MKNSVSVKFFRAAAIAALFSVSAYAADGPGFPRLGGVLIGSPQNYEDPKFQAQIARLDFALLNTWKGWQGYSGSGVSLNQVVNSIKGINPNIKLFQYTMLEQIGAGQASSVAFADQFNKVTAMNWWVYDSGTSGNKALSSWQGSFGPFYEVNLTSFAPVDGNGQRWSDWYANWVLKTFVTPNPNLDGLYSDGVSWFPYSKSAADWNRDGTPDPSKNAQTAQWYRQGYAAYWERLRTLAPGRLLIANVANWGDSSSTLTEYNGALNGGVMEDIIGQTWSPETFGGWSGMMKWYRKTMAALAAPKLGVFTQNITSITDYQTMRYGLTSCLMDDGYYAPSPNDDFHTVLWYDEFDSNLGQATSSPPTAAWQNGVYRRDFQNGIALVNPKGNGTRTVTLEAGFKRLSGNQDPSTNSGQTATTVTLKDRDGHHLTANVGAADAADTTHATDTANTAGAINQKAEPGAECVGAMSA